MSYDESTMTSRKVFGGAQQNVLRIGVEPSSTLSQANINPLQFMTGEFQ